MLEARKPIYVAAGFGGAAANLAGLLRGEPSPPGLSSSRWTSNPDYQGLINTADARFWSAKLGLPSTIDELAERIRVLGREVLVTDAASLAWNGLTIAENHELFHTRDAVRITTLTVKGLLQSRRNQNAGNLAVELVNGDLSLAPRASAICVAIYRDAPVVGAGAALDNLLGRAVTKAQLSLNEIDVIPIANSSIDADWLVVAKFGDLQSDEPMDQRIRKAAEGIVKITRRYGFSVLATVVFGGSFAEDLTRNCDAMLAGFTGLTQGSRLAIFEIDARRFAALKSHLSGRNDLDLTTHRNLERQAIHQDAPTFVSVNWIGDQLITALLTPPANGLAFNNRTSFSASDLTALSTGEGDRRTPAPEEIEKRRQFLAEKLFGPNYQEWFKNLAGTRVVIRHDLITSQIPFEILIAPNEGTTGLGGNVTRILALADVDPRLISARPPKKGKINLLLVIDPTQDLDAARREGEAVYASLKNETRIAVVMLGGSEATKAAVRENLEFADIFHYCGHACFDLVSGGGIDLADGRLTSKDLPSLTSVPRLAFVNGCEAGRVRGSGAKEETGSLAFAELFLRMGIETYLGTYWKVQDSGAESFAKSVYGMLAQGAAIGEAVQRSRRKLAEEGKRDWVNYILYGSTDFRIAEPDAIDESGF
jgi:CHAT domain-containing protein